MFLTRRSIRHTVTLASARRTKEQLPHVGVDTPQKRASLRFVRTPLKSGTERQRL